MDRAHRAVALALAGLLAVACGSAPEAGGTGISPLVDPVPAAPDPAPAEPDPVPAAPDPAPAEPDPVPAADAADSEGEAAADADPPRAAVPAQTPLDVTVVPDTITAAYVDAVLVELERLFFEALHILRTEQELTIEATDRLGSVLTEQHYQLRLGEFLALVEDGFPGIRAADDLRPRIRRVDALLDVATDCIYAETTTDHTGFVVDPTEGEKRFVVLRLADRSRHVNLNTSPWVYARIALGDPDTLRVQRPC